MGWGTSFKQEIYLNRVIFDDISDVQDAIKDKELSIADAEKRMLMFASSNIKDVVPDEWKDEPINYIHNQVSALIEEMMSDHLDLLNLRSFFSYVENGGSIKGDTGEE